MAIDDFNVARLDVHFGKTIATMAVVNITKMEVLKESIFNFLQCHCKI
jgi:hypothetical protein